MNLLPLWVFLTGIVLLAMVYLRVDRGDERHISKVEAYYGRRRKKLKVIHIWNTANIGGLIARYMDRMHETDSQVYMWERWDPFRQATEKVILYRTAFGNKIGKLKTPFILLKARHFDIIHNQGLDGMTPWLRLLYPNKKIILHYHGTRIRGKWKQKKKFWRYADRILVSTPDLLEGAPEGTLYIPNLINWDLVDELRGKARRGPLAFTVSRWCDDEARAIAKKIGRMLHVHDREKNPMKHSEFLRLLNQFSVYIDIKRDFYSVPGSDVILRAHSLTALEALGLGLRVLNWDGEDSEIDIRNHRPENVIPLLWTVYNEEDRS